MPLPPETDAPADLRSAPAVGRTGARDVARDRLLDVSLQLFAEQGFAKTSIRQIAQAAGTNVAAVSYYFGNKAGLYKAACCCGADATGPVSVPLGNLDDFFARLLAPLRSGGQARLRVKLLRREMLEPSGLWKEQVDRGLCPLHDALVGWLCERLNVATPDDDIHALAVLVIAPALHLLMNCELIDVIAPRLLRDDAAVDAWCGRLRRNADLLIADASRHRAAAASPRPSRSPA